MQPFRFTRAKDTGEAIAQLSRGKNAKVIAGGTNLVDLMKLDIEQPDQLVDISGLGMDSIEEQSDGGIHIGAFVRNSDLAYHPLILERYPVLSQALLAGASPQLRNMATTGGNLLQRTRCPYFYDTAFACNKRSPGSGCAAMKGYNRNHAILGTSDKCIATHPSDMCVALNALDALINIKGANGEHTVSIRDFHLLPGDTPQYESILGPGDLITSVTIAPLSYGTRSCYLKVRDRASYDFALASAAVALDIQNGRIRESNIALGGVGTRPWHAEKAEKILRGKSAGTAVYEEAADAVFEDARPHEHNKFKIALGKRTLIRALETAQQLS